MRYSRPSPTAHAALRGFTLIELLVVIAIISLLLSILLPSLSSAREQARMVVCGQRMADMGKGLASYYLDNEDWLPGLNTSGFAVSELRFSWAGNPSVLAHPRLPVQTFDWMTPILAGQMELPASREARFSFILNDMGCPSQKYTCPPYDDGLLQSPDRSDFVGKRYKAVSYLMPVAFAYYGTSYGRRGVQKPVLGYYKNQNVSSPVEAETMPEYFEVDTLEYKPRIDRVGDASRKIFIADGTRYLEQASWLDFDTNPKPNWFGSFTSAGGWWSGSVAYGVAGQSSNWGGRSVSRGSLSGGLNLALSYRHGASGSDEPTTCQANRGSIQALYFDGHVGRLNDRQSREPHLWYPAGSIINTPDQGMTYTERGDVIP